MPMSTPHRALLPARHREDAGVRGRATATLPGVSHPVRPVSAPPFLWGHCQRALLPLPQNNLSPRCCSTASPSQFFLVKHMSPPTPSTCDQEEERKKRILSVELPPHNLIAMHCRWRGARENFNISPEYKKDTLQTQECTEGVLQGEGRRKKHKNQKKRKFESPASIRGALLTPPPSHTHSGCPTVSSCTFFSSCNTLEDEDDSPHHLDPITYKHTRHREEEVREPHTTRKGTTIMGSNTKNKISMQPTTSR